MYVKPHLTIIETLRRREPVFGVKGILNSGTRHEAVSLVHLEHSDIEKHASKMYCITYALPI